MKRKKITIKKTMAVLLSLLLAAGMLAGCTQETAVQATGETGEAESVETLQEKYEGAHVLLLNEDGTATLDGEALEEFDYTWHADPSEVHDDVKNSPAEYYTGTEPDTDAAAYIAHDLIYYPQLDESAFVAQKYDDETEWCYYYTAEGYEDYIFSTLPYTQGSSSVPTSMMHSEEEAYANPVLHIQEAGTYILQGTWNGQIYVDLGDSDDTFTDPEAKVTLIFAGADITCTAAPGVIFASVYECDNTWEDRDEYSPIVDTTDAGANVIIADGTENSVTGTNVFRILKTKFKDDSVSYAGQAQKKSHKMDGAFYSFQSMNINGEEEGTGVLTINSSHEGLDSELHLTINGGVVNIFAQDDGINVNEDGVSVFTINGGSVHILGGLGSEGDGVDSNGYLVINGGTVVASASPMSDSGLDSDKGSFIYGGTVLALGSTMDWAESDGSDATQAVMNLQFSSYESADEEIEIKDADGNTVFYYEPENDTVIGGNARQYRGAIVSCEGLKVGETYTVYVGGVQQGYSASGQLGGFGGPGGFGGQGGPMGEPPEGFDGERPEMPEGFDGEFPGEPPEGFNGQGGPMGEPPEGFNGEFPGEPPEGFNGERPEMPGQPGGQFPGQETASGELTAEFVMEDTVNGFSGVSDLAE